MSETASRSVTVHGVKIHVEREGWGSPVVLLHGFSGTTRSMAGLARGLHETHRSVSIDLIGHGCSDAPEDLAHYTMSRCVEQVIATLDLLGVVRPHLLGYSMGGRVALALCAAHPQRFASAMLIGASPGLAKDEERQQRVRSDEELAHRIEREGVPAFVDYWMALPMFASAKRLGSSALEAARTDRLRNTACGLSNSLRGMGTGAQPPLHASLQKLKLPILLVVGELDSKFRAIAASMRDSLPNGRIEVVNGAGHAAHLERPTEVIRLARRFFRNADSMRPASKLMRTPAP